MQDGENTIRISAGTIAKVIIIGLLFWVFFILKDLVLVILLSIVVASAVEPGAQWFIRRKIPRLFSVIIIYLFIAICLIGLIYFLLVPLLSESSDFLRNFPSYFNVNDFTDTISNNSFLRNHYYKNLTP